MREPNKKHTLAILRRVIREKAETFAPMVGCTASAIHSIESGRLKLSATLAGRIALETGVSAQWLIDNERKAPIVDGLGEAYTITNYQERRAALREQECGLSADSLPGAKHMVEWIFEHVLGLYTDAVRKGNLRLLNFKLSDAVMGVGLEMGLIIPHQILTARMNMAERNTEKPDVQPLIDAFWSVLTKAVET